MFPAAGDPPHPDDDDAVRDALALIEAAHRHDFEGIRVIRANARLRLVVVVLARIADDLIGRVAEYHDADEGDMLARLRDIWT